MADLNTVGQSKRFNYTGGVQSINLNPGIYKLECYGASGGHFYDYYNNIYSASNTERFGGFNGGYSVGYYSLKKAGNLYIGVGGRGGDSYRLSNAAGPAGYNGGGRGGRGLNYLSSGGGGGGGATHIATTNRGVLSNYNSYRKEILIVAGGGGGGGCYGWGVGYGGGLSGGTVHAYYKSETVPGGTQTTGYAFGQGQNGRDSNGGGGGSEGNGGGGGGWYGGYAYQGYGYESDSRGAGGSGYIGGVSATIKTETATYTSSTTGNINSGNGYAIITLLEKRGYITCTDCVSSLDAYLLPNEEITFNVTTSRTIIKNNVAYYINNLKVTPEIISFQKINDTLYKFLIPANTSIQEIYIEIDVEKIRYNSDFYKDSLPISAFDFKTLFNESDITGE